MGKQFKIYEAIPGVDGGFFYTDVKCDHEKTLSLLCLWTKSEELQKLYVQDQNDPAVFHPLSKWVDAKCRARRLDAFYERMEALDRQ